MGMKNPASGLELSWEFVLLSPSRVGTVGKVFALCRLSKVRVSLLTVIVGMWSINSYINSYQ